jgi:hypothetical protein
LDPSQADCTARVEVDSAALVAVLLVEAAQGPGIVFIMNDVTWFGVIGGVYVLTGGWNEAGWLSAKPKQNDLDSTNGLVEIWVGIFQAPPVSLDAAR